MLSNHISGIRLAAAAVSVGSALSLSGCCSTQTCCGSACAAGTSQVCCPPSDADTAGVRDATTAFYAALNQVFVDDVAPMESVWSHEPDVSQLGPMGGRLVGWDAVGADWRRVAGLKLGGKVVAENVMIVAGPCMGYSVTGEVGQNLGADGKSIEVRFRATNIFRKERDGWKMVHHHTDLSQGLIAETGLVK
ncbi:MAG: nuclear transport factor 2 family protein [Planctomycetota bacterium]|nr:nuclear transport factor 2 family protein [Planctomycetota bacterium]MDA1106156.1 nuclear transport factor 2 family protein [Planctomycetota bacterium]